MKAVIKMIELLYSLRRLLKGKGKPDKDAEQPEKKKDDDVPEDIYPMW